MPTDTHAAGAASYQTRVDAWLMACFGEAISRDKVERNHRFLEEALELVQACDCTASEAHQLVDYVFGRPVGEPHQESGGVSNTHAALCLAQGIDMEAAAEAELARVWTKVEKIRAKQAAKPKNSPLPATASPAPGALGDLRVLDDKAQAALAAWNNGDGKGYALRCMTEDLFMQASAKWVRTLIASSPAASAPPVDGGTEGVRERFPYQPTFDAIAAATRIEASGIAISVDKFWHHFAAIARHATPDGETVDFGMLANPAAVYINMLSGVIAKPSVECIIHLYGADALRAALPAAATAAPEQAGSRGLDLQALDALVVAEAKRVGTIEAYNAELVRQRERGVFPVRVQPEYEAMENARHEFWDAQKHLLKVAAARPHSDAEGRS